MKDDGCDSNFTLNFSFRVQLQVVLITFSFPFIVPKFALGKLNQQSRKFFRTDGFLIMSVLLPKVHVNDAATTTAHIPQVTAFKEFSIATKVRIFWDAFRY